MVFDREIIATEDTKITIENGKFKQTVNLYSEEGRKLMSTLQLKLAAQYKTMYEPTWLGVPVIQLSNDMVMMQELIYKIRPDLIIECGIAHGGSLIFYASIFEILQKGRIIGIDVEIRKYNEVVIQSHPLSHRIELIQSSSIEESLIPQLQKKIRPNEKVMVILDSNHSTEHVYRELQMYSPLVSPGSYCIAMDGAQAFVWDIPRGNPEHKNQNPYDAIHRFLAENKEFEIDPYYTRMDCTSSPDGFLRRKPLEPVRS